MKKIIHPLWTHIPPVAALLVLAVYIIGAGQLPATAAVHFGKGGLPDSFGSPWMVFGLTIGLSVLYILISVLIDELWARQEKSKKFNWLSLMDDIIVGTMAGASVSYLHFLESGAGTFQYSVGWMLLLGGGATLLGVILETVRPYRAYEEAVFSGEDSATTAELAAKLRKNLSFVYWDNQNPAYVTFLTTILPLAMFIVAGFSWFSEPAAALILIFVGAILIIPNGGQRTLITRQGITIRWGIFGIGVLRLNTANITDAVLHDFAPLRDFGGYGIRFNREMKAYFLRGTRGVKITVSDGKKYLVGSDHPERLLAVVQTAAGIAE